MQWKKGEHYLQVKGSILGPFGGRIYSTLVPLHVRVPELHWASSVDHIVCRGVRILRDKRLIVSAGYKCDGPSGPTWDDRTNMRGACAHDALYMLLRRGLLGGVYSEHWRHNRRVADELLGKMMIEDGAYTWRARYYVWAVHHFGSLAAGGMT